MRRAVIALGLVVGFFLIVRAVVEPFTIDYSDPSSYADDWVDRASPACCWFIAAWALIAAIWIGIVLWRRRSNRESSPRAMN